MLSLINIIRISGKPVKIDITMSFRTLTLLIRQHPGLQNLLNLKGYAIGKIWCSFGKVC